jgi:hypothetical protein
MSGGKDRLSQIINGLERAGCGTFALTFHPSGHWVAAVEFGKEAEDSDMVGAASYGADVNPWVAIRQVLDETRWDEL